MTVTKTVKTTNSIKAKPISKIKRRINKPPNKKILRGDNNDKYEINKHQPRNRRHNIEKTNIKLSYRYYVTDKYL